MQCSFENMSKVELRAYLIANPGDQEAFHMFVDRLPPHLQKCSAVDMRKLRYR
jgi:hypothetical protein